MAVIIKRPPPPSELTIVAGVSVSSTLQSGRLSSTTGSVVTRRPGAERSTANNDGPAIDRAITNTTSADAAAGTNNFAPDSCQSLAAGTALVRTSAGSQEPACSATATVAETSPNSMAFTYS